MMRYSKIGTAMDEEQYFRLNRRALELMTPIIKQINMTDDREELLLLAFAMMNKSRQIIDANLGEDKRKSLFKEYV
jgi:hypothetical protein